MLLTCGLPVRHPIVVISVINALLGWTVLYVSAYVLHEPPGLYPYPILAISALGSAWAPIYFVAHPDEMHRAFFNRSIHSRIPGDKPGGGFFRNAGYLVAIGYFMMCVYALLDSFVRTTQG